MDLVRWSILVVITIELLILFRYVWFLRFVYVLFYFCLSQYSLFPHLPFPSVRFSSFYQSPVANLRLDWIVFSVDVLLLIFPSSVHILYTVFVGDHGVIAISFSFSSLYLSSIGILVIFCCLSLTLFSSVLFCVSKITYYSIGLDYIVVSVVRDSSSHFHPPSSSDTNPILLWFDSIRYTIL